MVAAPRSDASRVASTVTEQQNVTTEEEEEAVEREEAGVVEEGSVGVGVAAEEEELQGPAAEAPALVEAPFDALAECPISRIPVPQLTYAARDQWALRLGPLLGSWQAAYPVHENFIKEPPRMHRNPVNNEVRLLPRERAWVDREFGRLLEMTTIGKALTVPRRIHPWRLVPKKGPKLYRLVVNMISTNRFLRYVWGRYEDLRAILPLIKRNTWFMTRDMTDAYFMIHVHPRSYEYLGFVWRNQYYWYRTLLFGLADSAGVFTSVISGICDYWRSKGVITLRSFFDDLFWAHESREMVELWHQFILAEARLLGITFDAVKGNVQPTQVGVVLGL